MDGVKDLAAVIGLHNRLRPVERHVDMLVDDARKGYGRIDYRSDLSAGGRTTLVISGPVELENKT